jgi:L-lysine 6-transaminase
MSSTVFQTEPSKVHETLRNFMLTDGMPIVYDPQASRGSRIVDQLNGRSYLDLFSFFASMPVGHNHPQLADAAFRERLLLAAQVKPSNSDIYTQAFADFVTAFGRTLPPDFVHLFFIEGGALAVENALKVAFDWKVRKNIAKGQIKDEGDPQLGTRVIHFKNAFHGRSGYTLSLTNGTQPNKTKFFPKFDWPRVSTPGVRFPIEDHLAQIKAAEDKSLTEIEQAIDDDPDGIAALIIETIQGEGGDVHFRPEFMQALRKICDTREVVLIFDEIQAGMGITGKWWAFEHTGVQPDIFCFGKKSQVCGIASTARVDDVESCFKVASRINSTWGGNLVDMVRCTRYIEIIESEGLLQNAAAMGAHLREGLHALATQFDVLSNVRGRGLMSAFDLPDCATRDRLSKAMMDEGALILPCGAASLRFRPVLDFSRQDADLAVEKLSASLRKL